LFRKQIGKTQAILFLTLFSPCLASAELIITAGTGEWPVPIALLRGYVPPQNQDCTVIHEISGSRSLGLVRQGQFKVLVPLQPGENPLRLVSGAQEQRLSLYYRPPGNDHLVKVVVMTERGCPARFPGASGQPITDYQQRIATGLSLMQTFTADRMAALGLGRISFNLERDAQGQVIVHTKAGDLTAAEYEALGDQGWWRHVQSWVKQALPATRCKYVVFSGYTRYDPVTGRAHNHTALGGGDLGLFGGANIFTWPKDLNDVTRALSDATVVDRTLVYDDSGGRSTFWGLAATTLGATLHELGHALGLPHVRDPQGIMSRGFDHFGRAFLLTEATCRGQTEPRPIEAKDEAIWAPASAGILRGSPWLGKLTASSEAEASLLLSNGIVFIKAPAGLGAVCLESGERAISGELFWNHEPSPTVWSQSYAALYERLGPTGAIRVVDRAGRISHKSLGELRPLQDFVSDFVPLGNPLPWPDSRHFVTREAKDLAALQASLDKAELVKSPQARIDFKALFAAPHEQVSAVVGRRLVCSQKQTLRLLLGSDDALRVWLNGQLICERLVLRSALPDQDTVTIELTPGVHHLLIEVSQGQGDWALYLRLENDQGQALKLSDNGEIKLKTEN